MNEQKNKVLAEFVEQAGYVIKVGIASEMAMNDGDIALCQKYTKEVQAFLKTMVKDVFEECKEAFSIQHNNTNDYDIPNMLELVKQLAEGVYYAGVLQGLIMENAMPTMQQNTAEKFITALQTVTEIYIAMFEN